jgi:hypothetical protein
MKSMNLVVVMLLVVLCGLFSGCQEKTAQEKVKAVSSKIYALTADEMNIATVNAQQFFGKEWPTKDNLGADARKRGLLVMVRPSDSNFNGLVTCIGKIPKIEGGFDDVTVYCGYQDQKNGGFLGCNDQDSVGK